ncbi:MAG: tetratricopeptide repeat protein [Bacteroidales bacterium]|jgi:tetratricopeptide (TPR) repeat protein|nr:tetratricopeptide repeat protein [Bacteroidales bacterium]
MNYRRDSFWYDDEMLNSVNRYEDMLKNHTCCFFDVCEFEDIIDYYLDSENFTKAATAADYASRIYPRASSIQLRMAEILIDRSQPVKALNLLNRLGQLDSDEYGVYLLRGAALNMMGKPREAQRQFEKAISMADENRTEVLYNIGMSFERINQHKVALKYFMKVRAMEPENYYVFYDLAYCYERLDELDQSIACYRKYLDEDPFSEHVWYNLGIVYNKKDDSGKALEAYDFAIAINQSYSSAHFNKANTLSLLERYREAIDTYFEFLEIEPDNAAAYCYIGECYERLEESDLARIHYLKSLSLDDRFADAWFGLGMVKSQAGNYEEAVTDILRALALDKDNTEYLFSLASTYANMQHYEKAVALFKKLVQLITGDIYMWDCFAQIYAKQDAFVEAQRIIIEALHFNPDAALLHYRLAAYFLLNNEQLQGLIVLEEILKTNPEESDCFFDVFEAGDMEHEVMALMNKYRK